MSLETRKGRNQQDQVDKVESEQEPAAEGGGVGRLSSIYDRVYDMAEKFACTHFGQFVIKRGDRVLRVIENTAKWSVPQEKSELKLERPLPWLPFLTMIVWLRLIRIWLSIGAILIGNGPILPGDVVYFIQTRRRKLRAIRVNGAKVIHRQEAEAETNAQQSAGDTPKVGLLAKMRKLLTSAICRPGMHYEPIRRIYISSDYEAGEDTQTNRPQSVSGKRPRDEESMEDLDDNDLTFEQKLTKYANQSSDDDDDFIPNPNDDTHDESNTSTASDTSIDEAQSQNQKQQHREDSNQQTTQHAENPEFSTPTNDESEPNAEVQLVNDAGEDRARSMPKPIEEIKKEQISDVESGSDQPQTPKENGQGDSVNREADVARKYTQATGYRLNVPFGEAELQKATPGHESAATMKPSAMPFASTTAAAAPVSSVDTPNFFSTPLKHPASLHTSNLNSNSTSNSNSSASASTSASTSTSSACSGADVSSDLDPFVTNEDIDADFGLHAPQGSTETARKRVQSLMHSSESSTDDDDEFYSPVGSPVDFDTFMKSVSMPVPRPAAENGAGNSTPTSTASAEASDTAPPARKYVPQPSSRQTQQPHYSHNNRYRGRNRR